MQVQTFVFGLLIFTFPVQKAWPGQFDRCHRELAQTTNNEIALATDLAKKLPPADTQIHEFQYINRLQQTPVKDPVTSEDFFAIKKLGMFWSSSYGPHIFAIESNPTYPIYLLGPELSHFFGIFLKGESELWLPHPHFFEKRLRLMNEYLARENEAPIPFHVYSQEDDWARNPLGPSTSYAENFVRHFIQHNEFPMSAKELKHDISHHALNILLTEEQIRPLIHRGRALIELTDFLRGAKSPYAGAAAWPQQADQPLPPYLNERVIQLLYQIYSREIDNFSGGLPIFLIDQRDLIKQWEKRKIEDQLHPRRHNRFLESIASFFFNTEPSPECFEASCYFRLYSLHLGDAFSHPDRTPRQHVKRDFSYTTGNWLHFFVNHKLAKIFTDSEKVEKNNLSLRYFIKGLKRRGEWDSLIINRTEILASLSHQLDQFLMKHPAIDEEVLAKYDEAFDLQKGLASPEPLSQSLEKRILTLKAALLKYEPQYRTKAF